MAPWRPRSVQEPPVSTGRFTFDDAASMHLQESTTGRGRFRYGRVRLLGTQPSLVLFARSGSVACLMAARVEADDRDNPTSGGGTNAVGGIRRKDAIREVPEPDPFRVIGDDLGAERSRAQPDERIRP